MYSYIHGLPTSFFSNQIQASTIRQVSAVYSRNGPVNVIIQYVSLVCIAISLQWKEISDVFSCGDCSDIALDMNNQLNCVKRTTISI